MRIAACYIARNEAKNIGRSLSGLKERVDGIFLVDTGSVDDTVKLAREAGACVAFYSWKNDFAAARNFALAQVPEEYDWILFLDADEYLAHPEEVRPYLEWVEKHCPEKEAVMVNIANIDADNGNREFHRFLNIRLFRHDRDLCYAGRVHEMIHHRSGGQLQLLVERQKLLVYHTGYSHGIVRQKVLRNLALLQENIRQYGERPQDYRYLSDCYFGLKDYAKALDYAKKAIAAPVSALGSNSDMYRHLIESMRQLGYSDQELLSAADEAITKFPELPDFYAERGMVLCGLQQPEAAKKSFEQALDKYGHTDDAEASYFAGVVDIVWRRLGELCQLLGDNALAEEYISKALQHNRYMLEAFQAYYHLHEAGTIQEKTAALSKFFMNNEQDNRYLLSCAAKLGDNELLLYYGKRLQRPTQQEKMMISLYQQFRQGAEDLSDRLAALGAQAVHDLFLNLLHTDGEAPVIQAAAELLPASLQHCLLRYWGGKELLPEAELSDYLSMMPAAIQEADPDLLQRYVSIAADFSLEGQLQTAHCLYQKEAWTQAAELYKKLSVDQAQQNQDFWRETGIIALHQGRHAEAAAALRQAQSLGDVSRETESCLYWAERENKDD